MDAGFSLRDGLQLVFKHGALIAVCALLVTALVWGGLALQPRTYEGAAKLWIKTEQQPMPSFLSGLAAYRDAVAPDPVNRKIETEIELLLSRDSAARVVAQLRIEPEQLRRSPLDVVKSRLRGALGIAAKPLSADEQQARQHALVDEFLKGFAVEAQRSKGADTSSNVLEIRFTATDPALVPRAIDALVQAYIQLAAQQNRRLGEATFQLLEGKANEARADLARSERELQAFMAAQGERASRATPRGSVAAVAEGGDATAASVVGLMKSQAAELQRRLDDLKQIYTEEASNVRAMARSIEGLRQRIKDEVRANAQADAQLAQFERQRALAQERFVELQKRLDQIDLYLKVNPTEAESRVLTQSPERPLVPETRKRTLVLLLGPLGGLLLGLALAALRELFDRRLQSPDEVNRALGLEVLAALPALTQRRVPADRLARGQRRRSPPRDTGPTTTGLSEAAGVTLQPGESLRELVPVVSPQVATDRSLLMHRLALRVSELVHARATLRRAGSGASTGSTKALGHVLLVTSARAGEGKSVIARALAKRLAVQGRGHVLLIDGSAESPAGHGGQRVRGRPGFFDILREREVMAEVAGSRDTPGLQTLGVGFDPDPSLLYHEAAVDELFEKVRERYDWTVVDAGALAQIGCLGSACDATLVVVDAQTTRREVVQGALGMARIPSARLLGAVLNRRPQYVPAWVYRFLL